LPLTVDLTPIRYARNSVETLVPGVPPPPPPPPPPPALPLLPPLSPRPPSISPIPSSITVPPPGPRGTRVTINEEHARDPHVGSISINELERVRRVVDDCGSLHVLSSIREVVKLLLPGPKQSVLSTQILLELFERF
ncbi:hypothetical protein V1478_017046, partial [Vespula squamosa]